MEIKKSGWSIFCESWVFGQKFSQNVILPLSVLPLLICLLPGCTNESLNPNNSDSLHDISIIKEGPIKLLRDIAIETPMALFRKFN